MLSETKILKKQIRVCLIFELDKFYRGFNTLRQDIVFYTTKVCCRANPICRFLFIYYARWS